MSKSTTEAFWGKQNCDGPAPEVTETKTLHWDSEGMKERIHQCCEEGKRWMHNLFHLFPPSQHCWILRWRWKRWKILCIHLFLPHIVFLSCFVIIFFVSLGCIFFLRPLCFIQLLLRFMCFCSCFSYNFRCFLKQFDLLGPPYKAIAWKSYKKQIFLYVYLQ